MIGKIIDNNKGGGGSSRSAGATINYQIEGGELVYSQGLNLEPEFHAVEMNAVCACNRRVTDPIQHIVISMAEGEKPSDKQCTDICKHALESMGYKGYQAVAYLANDNDNKIYHLHITCNRVHPETYKAASDGRSEMRLEKSMRELEIKHGFTRVNTGHHWRIHNDKPIMTSTYLKIYGNNIVAKKAISDKAIAFEKNTGKESFETYWIKSDESKHLRSELTALILKGEFGWNDIHKCFDKYNLELTHYVDEKRKRDGYVIIDKSDNKARITASKFDVDSNIFKNRFLAKTIGLPFETPALGLIGNNVRGYTQSLINSDKKNPVYQTYINQKSQYNSQVKQLDQQKYGNLTPEQTLKLAINVIQQTSTNFTDKKIIDLAVNFGGHAREELKLAFNGLIDTAKVIHLSDVKSGDRLYSSSYMIKLEQSNIDRVNKLSGSFQSQTNSGEVNAYLDNWQAQKGFELTDGQRKAIINVLCNSHGVSLLQGDPGAGKTTLTEAVEDFNRDVLVPSGRGNYTIGVAFTGKAAAELTESLGHNAFTISSFVNKKFEPVSAKSVDNKVDDNPNTIRIPVGRSILLKVDEASFVGSKQFEQLLNKRDELEKTFKVPVKIEFCGDSKQKQAIAAGNPFEVAQELTTASIVVLKDITRQKDANLLEVATLFNAQDKLGGAQQGFDKLQSMGCVSEFKDAEKLMHKSVNDYFNLVGKEHKYIDSRTGKESSAILKTGGIIVSTNAERHVINSMVRAERINRGEIGEGENRKIVSPVSFSAEKLTSATNFNVGQFLQFHDGKFAEITDINTKNNSLSVHFEERKVNGEIAVSGEGHDGNKTIHLTDYHDKINVFELIDQKFSVGDKIVCLQNTDWCKNGTLFEIKKYDENNNIVVHGPNNTEINFDGYNKFAHAYALTTEKSQGATWDFAVRHAKLTLGRGVSHNSENVGITRARYVSLVNTDSIKLYRNQLKSVDKKENTLNHNGTLKLVLAETKLAFEKSIKQLDKDTRKQVTQIIKKMQKGVAGKISYKEGQLTIDKLYLNTAQMKATLHEKYISDKKTIIAKYDSVRGNFKDYVVKEANKGNGDVIREIDKMAPNHPMVNNNRIITDKPISTAVIEGKVSIDSGRLLTPDKAGADKPKDITDIKMVQEKNGDVECRWKDTNAVAFKITREGIVIKEHSQEAIKASLELSATANNGVVAIKGSQQYEKLANEIAKEVITLKTHERERDFDRSMEIRR